MWDPILCEELPEARRTVSASSGSLYWEVLLMAVYAVKFERPEDHSAVDSLVELRLGLAHSADP